MFNIGDIVKAFRLSADSNFHQVIGEVQDIQNGYVCIKAISVMSKFLDDGIFKKIEIPFIIATKIAYAVKL